MSAASAPITFLFRPTSTFIINNSTRSSYLPKLNSPKSVSSLPLPSSKLYFSSAKSLSAHHTRGCSPNAMSNSVGDEGSSAAFEQESLINEFRPTSRGDDGLEATLNRASKWIVAALFSAVLVWRHDAGALWAAMGSVLNTGLSTILKHVLNHERPASNLRSDPGMPSSHAQSFFFSVVFVIVSMFQGLGVNGLTITLSGLTLAFGSYLSWLRVSQQLHTVSQVVVGAVLGSAFCILWFWSWDAIVLQAFISYLWVRIVIILGATIFCVGFLIHVVQHWLMDR